MGDLEQCKQAGEDVCIQANDANSPNYNAIAGRAKSIISGAYKMEKDFVKAEEFLNSSTEVGLFLSLVEYCNVLYICYFHLSNYIPCPLSYCIKVFSLTHVCPLNSSILSL